MFSMSKLQLINPQTYTLQKQVLPPEISPSITFLLIFIQFTHSFI